ncbi:Uncharacterized protein Adt_35728 [Abeliophyllum distichum]|uniref:Uncharacterized protein n=1 Tax=Abeliophyllum distichum TaxID=126358 RepID=A0ABD1QFJ3_9LAMI
MSSSLLIVSFPIILHLPPPPSPLPPSLAIPCPPFCGSCFRASSNPSNPTPSLSLHPLEIPTMLEGLDYGSDKHSVLTHHPLTQLLKFSKANQAPQNRITWPSEQPKKEVTGSEGNWVASKLEEPFGTAARMLVKWRT